MKYPVKCHSRHFGAFRHKHKPGLEVTLHLLLHLLLCLQESTNRGIEGLQSPVLLPLQLALL